MIIESLNVWSGKTGPIIRQYLEGRASLVDVFCFQEAAGDFNGMSRSILGGEFSRFFSQKWVSDKDIFDQEIWVRNSFRVHDVRTVIMEEKDVGLGLAVNLKDSGLTVVNIHGVSRPGDKKDTPKRLGKAGGY